MKRLICFDVDGTLTQHRTRIEQDNKELLERLDKEYKLLIVGAGNAHRIFTQLDNFPVDILANYGMQESICVNGKQVIIREDKSYPDRDYFFKTADMLRKKYGYTEYKGDSVEFHPTGMVTFPLLGSNADIKDKIVFDPDRAKRRVMYDEVCRLFPDYTVYIGGSSSFDFSEKKYNKYSAISAYAKAHSYNESEILYVGDDFGDGGGDSHVRLGGIDYINVENYKKLKDYILEYLKK